MTAKEIVDTVNSHLVTANAILEILAKVDVATIVQNLVDDLTNLAALYNSGHIIGIPDHPASGDPLANPIGADVLAKLDALVALAEAIPSDPSDSSDVVANKEFVKTIVPILKDKVVFLLGLYQPSV